MDTLDLLKLLLQLYFLTISPAIPSLDEKSLSKEERLPPAYSTLVLVKENEEVSEDPWDLPELKDTGVKWSGKAARFCDCSIQRGSLHKTDSVLFVFFANRSRHKGKGFKSVNRYSEAGSAAWTSLHVYLLT